MNVIIKDRKMSVTEAVQQIADTFAELEEAVRTGKKGFRSFGSPLAVIRDAGHLGGLDAQAMTCEADALVTQFEASLLRMHADWTERAKAAGIDLPQRSGGR